MTVTLFCLHALGSSAREFDTLAARLGPDVEVVGLDLPGFGNRAVTHGTSVADMVADVEARITAHRSAAGPDGAGWAVLGHSMGGKVATVIAHRATTGRSELGAPAAVVLLAASPPSPEPMDESRRADMLTWSADGPISAADARTFVDANVGAALPTATDGAAIADVRRADPAAWTAWLESGSREDWSDRIGTIDVPAVVVAGGSDGDLGPDAQRALNLPLYPSARLVVLEGAGHLLPLERPEEVAEQVRSVL